MLSAGFATTDYLKSRLLPAAAAEETDWDEVMADLGKSVAGKFDRHCNRRFARDTAAVDVFSARAAAWVLTRYPVEDVAAVELVDPDGTAEAIAEGDWWLEEKCGLLETETIAGDRRQKLRVTYAGGYWLNPRDATPLPADATELPGDVLEAWIAQCQHEAESRGLFEAVSMRAQTEQNAPKTAGLSLLEDVVAVLRPYRRFGGE